MGDKRGRLASIATVLVPRIDEDGQGPLPRLALVAGGQRRAMGPRGLAARAKGAWRGVGGGGGMPARGEAGTAQVWGAAALRRAARGAVGARAA